MSALVRRATPAETDELVNILTEGFAQDPFLVWIYETPDQYRRLAPDFFQWMTERTMAIGQAYVAGDGKGALLGQPSSTVDTSDEEDKQIHQQLRAIGSECAGRLLAFIDAAHEHHPMEKPHWYFTFLAVRPEHQNQGLGGALLRDALAETGLPGYLEATWQRNRALYERLGYKAIKDFPVADGVSLCAMWCEAAAS
jgi:GNAT superfamily N-acetyltransferase